MNTNSQRSFGLSKGRTALNSPTAKPKVYADAGADAGHEVARAVEHTGILLRCPGGAGVREREYARSVNGREGITCRRISTMTSVRVNEPHIGDTSIRRRIPRTGEVGPKAAVSYTRATVAWVRCSPSAPASS